jgi:fatty-acyl-CoA synthase
MWAARRSGLYYALINTHLTAAEAAYIVDNSGARAVIGSRAMRAVCEGLVDHLPDGLPELLLIADDDLEGWQRYPECVNDQRSEPIADETEGDLLQYTSGTTGRPKGIRRELAHVAPAEAPNMLMPLMTAVGITRESVYLSPAPLYHTAPSFWSMAVSQWAARRLSWRSSIPSLRWSAFSGTASLTASLFLRCSSECSNCPRPCAIHTTSPA